MTARKILEIYLAGKKEVAYHELETEVQQFGNHFYNKWYNIGTYEREFRKLKMLGSPIFFLEKIEDKNNFDTWKIILKKG